MQKELRVTNQNTLTSELLQTDAHAIPLSLQLDKSFARFYQVEVVGLQAHEVSIKLYITSPECGLDKKTLTCSIQGTGCAADVPTPGAAALIALAVSIALVAAAD